MAKTIVESAITEKLGVLRDFYIVDDKNVDEITSILRDAISARPGGDIYLALDRAARKLIDARLGSGLI